MHLEHLYKDNRLIQNHSLVCMNSLFSAPSDPIYVSGKHGSVPAERLMFAKPVSAEGTNRDTQHGDSIAF